LKFGGIYIIKDIDEMEDKALSLIDNDTVKKVQLNIDK
jgi:hypothetical protein